MRLKNILVDHCRNNFMADTLLVFQSLGGFHFGVRGKSFSNIRSLVTLVIRLFL